MGTEYVLRFKSFEARPHGSPGSADIKFNINVLTLDHLEAWEATLTLPTAVTDGGIPGMIALAAEKLAAQFRDLAVQAERTAEAYREQIPDGSPRRT